MNQEELMEAGVDYAEGLKRFSNNAALYERFLKKFPQDPNFANLKASLEAKDYDAAFKCAHALKGVSGNLSLNRFYNQLIPLVETLRAGKSEGTDELFAALQEEYDTVTACLAANS